MQVEPTRELKAVHTSDLSELLQKYQMYDDFTNGNISCSVCGDKISIQNIGSLQKKSNKLLFTCNKSSCYNEITKTMNK